jgi:hypothetical protein
VSGKTIGDLEEGFQELQHYSDAQYKTISHLQQRIAQLESENNSLKVLVEQNLPALGMDTSNLVLGVSNEQLICETQLLNLKNVAVSRDLTMEETRKFQIFSDVLEKIKRKSPDEDEILVRKLTPAELLSIVSNE